MCVYMYVNAGHQKRQKAFLGSLPKRVTCERPLVNDSFRGLPVRFLGICRSGRVCGYCRRFLLRWFWPAEGHALPSPLGTRCTSGSHRMSMQESQFGTVFSIQPNDLIAL